MLPMRGGTWREIWLSFEQNSPAKARASSLKLWIPLWPISTWAVGRILERRESSISWALIPRGLVCSDAFEAERPALTFPGIRGSGSKSLMFWILKMWKCCFPHQVVIRKDKLMCGNKLVFENQRELRTERCYHLLSSMPPAHFSAEGLVLWAPWLNFSYRGQERIQEAARKNSACRKGSAEMQICFLEGPFQSTKLFNKVNVGRIFCKARGKKERQSDQVKNIRTAIHAGQGATTWSKDLMSSLGSLSDLPLFQYIFFSFLSKYLPSHKRHSSVGYIHHQGDIAGAQAQFLKKCSDCHPRIIHLSNQDILGEQKGACSKTALVS